MSNLILILSISIALCSAQGNVKYDPEPPAPSTTKPTSTAPTTTKPTDPTTTKPTHPTTTKPTDPTTTKPTTTPTTTKPTTTPPSTTKPPTTPPTKPTTPTPPPTPPTPDQPTEGTWELKEGNVTCIKIQCAIQIVIPYSPKSSNVTFNATINIPKSAQVSSGNCEVAGKVGNAQNITLQWMNAYNNTDHIKFAFIQNASMYELQGIELAISPDNKTFPGMEDKSEISLTHHHAEFSTNLLRSYKCEKEQMLNLTDSLNVTRGSIHVSHLQLQAFANSSTSTAFYSPIDCDTSSTPDVVPIAVGCALAILVIVVLIAYLIGRRRRQARGYLSM